MRILVYGAGNIGSLYAAKLKDAGNDVTILARGERLHDIRERGILLDDFHSRKRTITRINAVDRLDPDDAYDFVLVTLPRHTIREVLPALAANRNTRGVMFFGNNAGGPGEMIEALGRERVLLGFPGAAGVPLGETIRYLVLDRREQPTTFGELDGSKSTRIKAIAQSLQSAGFPISVCSNMDAWLKTHAAEIIPSALAFYMANEDVGQLKRNREALNLMLRAIREGFRVLSAIGIPLTPSSRRTIRWIPNFLLVTIARRKLTDDAMSIKIGHASAARDEMKAIVDEFGELVRQSGVKTPALDELRKHHCNGSRRR